MRQRPPRSTPLYSSAASDVYKRQVLTPQEIDELMEIMNSLKNEGKAIIFITHKLNEIKQVADRCTVLRRGKYIGTVETADVSPEQMSEMMVGRKVELRLAKQEFHPGETTLCVRDLCVANRENRNRNVLNHISFDLRRGEILCIAGIEGNGQSELAACLSGLIPADGGQIVLDAVSYTHLRAHETGRNLVCRLLLEKKKNRTNVCLLYTSPSPRDET